MFIGLFKLLQNMKLVFFGLLLFGLCTSLTIRIDASIPLSLNDNNVYLPLEADGYEGEVTYTVKGLPDGLYVRNNMIVGKTDNKNGYFPILIDAKDTKGNSASKICVLKVGSKDSSSSVNNGFSSTGISNTVNQGSGLSSNIRGNTISQIITSTSSSSSSTSSSSSPVNSFGNTLNSQNSGLNFDLNLDSPLTTPDYISTINDLIIPNSNIGSPSVTSPVSATTVQRTVSTSSVSSQPSNLESLLDQLAPRPKPQVQKIETVTYETNYQPFPTARIPNTTPSKIQNTQAPKSQANRNVITEDDIKTKAIFERQLNANKAIANLLDIVDQLRANVKAAQGDIQSLQTELQNAISFQRNTQATLTSAENKISRLKEAIKNMQGKIQLLNSQLNELLNSSKDTSATILTQENSIKNINAQVENHEKKLKELNRLIEQTNNGLKKVEGQIQETIRMIQDLKIQLEKKKKQVANIENLIDDAVRNVRNIDDEINDLKKRLNAAVDRKVKAEREQLRLRNLKANAPGQIIQLEDNIRNKQRVVEDLQKNKGEILQKIKDYNAQVDSTTRNLDAYQMKLKQIQTSITLTNGNKADFDKAISDKKKQISEATKTLQFLNGQLEPYEQALAAVYRQANQAAQSVNIAQQNLAAINSRWQQDNQKLQNALINLEKARSEKELADLAMEQLLQERSSALPYSIVPNGNGFTNPGSPTGNNPSGSALGPYPTGTAQAYNSLITSSTSSSRLSNSAQYPFSLYRNVQSISSLAPYLGTNGNIVPGFYQGANGITYNGNFRCGSTSSNSMQGTIRSIGNNAVKIALSSGNIVVGAISPCTSAFSNQPNYSPKVGDKITFSGQNFSDSIYNISSLSCIGK